MVEKNLKETIISTLLPTHRDIDSHTSFNNTPQPTLKWSSAKSGQTIAQDDDGELLLRYDAGELLLILGLGKGP
jgi:hypothetical protein